MVPPRCLCCKAQFGDKASHGRHLGNTPACQEYYETLSTQNAALTTAPASGRTLLENEPPARTPTPHSDRDHWVEANPVPEPPVEAAARPSKRLRVTVEDVEDEDAAPWKYEHYPGEAGKTFGKDTTYFKQMRAEQRARGAAGHAPFEDEEEWGLVKWLFTEVTQGGIDRYAKLPITRNRTKPSFKNKKAFFKKLDRLPTGTPWICDVLSVTGDMLGPKGQKLTEELELWRRDPVECVKELLGNPAFEPYTSYGPVRVTKGGVRHYSEMNTCEWWWDKQGVLPHGATVAPIILASDKTHLTVLRGDKTAWPVYLTVGNIDKAIRRKPSAHATVLLGYVPVAKLKCFSEGERSEAAYRLFHSCMAKMMAPLIEAGKTGVLMTCADGFVRRVFALLAVYVADHPEQCLVACCKENRCPRCTVPPKERGEPGLYPLRDHNESVDLLRRAEYGDPPEKFTEDGLRPVYRPFWAALPHTDIFSCISPDILHQLHKGVVKDHLMEWCKSIIGEDELDARFATLPEAHGLRHFSRGISVITQWTGGEAKQIEKVLLGLLVGQTSTRVQKAARALLDFVYYAQLEVHSDTTLARMDAALADFHAHKDEFIKLGIREHFNIPKLHALVHYVEAIRRLGCLDGLNTETSERFHIDYAKEAYRASSRREYFAQMTTWLQRQEAMIRQDSYLSWLKGELNTDDDEEDQDLEEDDDDEEEAGGEDSGEEDEDEDEDRVVDAESVNALRELINSNVTRAYQLPVKPSASRLSFQTLISDYGATAILPRLHLYLSHQFPNSPLPDLTTPLDVYHYVHLLLPPNIHVANSKRICKIRARPYVPRVADRKAISALFDCALFVEDEELYRKERGLAGLRAGQVRAIFRLPQRRGYDQEPLLYVRWFRPFRTPDSVTGLPPTSHSTRDQARHVEIVPASRLVRSCHLTPRFRQDDPDPEWTPTNILDEPITFSFNRYMDFHAFCALSI